MDRRSPGRGAGGAPSGTSGGSPLGFLAAVFALALSGPIEARAATADPAAALRVTSPAFREGAPIPLKHTCDGADASPALAWDGVPTGARSLVLICDDPDAPGGTWAHWVLYGLPPSARGLPAGVQRIALLPDGSRQGKNDFRHPGYNGPCPPPGKPHRYFFRVYALDAVLRLEGAVTEPRLEAAMKGHVLAAGKLMGTYGR